MAKICWTQENWDDGYVAADRFRVYRPDCPRSKPSGYADRAHVVWWMHTGKAHKSTHVLHHKNGDSMDDSIENLELCTRSEHLLAHRNSNVEVVCIQCGKTYYEKACVIRKRGSKFCSRSCLYEHQKYEDKHVECAWCGKRFVVRDDVQHRNTKYCSFSCFHEHRRKRLSIEKTITITKRKSVMPKKQHTCQFCGKKPATKEQVYCTNDGVHYNMLVYVCERDACVEKYGTIIREEEEG